jgi:hypothetical protein
VYLLIFSAYLGMRIYGFVYGDEKIAELSFDTISLSSCILFPRLIGSSIQDSVTFLGLRAMLADFFS